LQGTHRAMTFMIQQKHCRNLKKRKAKKGCWQKFALCSVLNKYHVHSDFALK
jgi:hypothetical protein